ncbi:MAG: hypothetical protein DRI99_05150, partial [Candidatus Aminicenantes bacterium]
LTRARQELYFIGVKKKYGGRYPFDLLESLPDLQAGQLLGPAKPQVKKAAPPRPGDREDSPVNQRDSGRRISF